MKKGKEVRSKRGSKISDSEWQVMQVLWRESPLTASAVVNELSEKTLWHAKTIRALLNRLVRKQALGYEKEGRQYHYYPLVTQAECVKAEARSFIKRVPSGAVKPMLAAFLEEEELSATEIAELRQILERRGGQDATDKS